ncbi:metallophosphoesterase family protein [Solwaraspora sp. WMMB335]|uniref:metallophosphoesterase family protein n=1 Tax=Solwaraspora sp. WMMB335 TaxID=3404118 RepID=UPI003B9503DD
MTNSMDYDSNPADSFSSGQHGPAVSRTTPAVSRRAVLGGAVAGGAAVTAGLTVTATPAAAAAGDEDGPARPGGQPLLCEPYLLDPRSGAVYVVWHTEGEGRQQVVLVGPAVAGLNELDLIAAATGERHVGPGWRRFTAESTRLTRTREDAASSVPGRSYSEVTERHVYRHLADVTGLESGRTAYRVVSVDRRGRATVTPTYSLAPAAPRKKSVKLLLTSDHQLKNMTPANLEKVAETVGVQLDGVLIAGDLVNVPDRASEWFDSGTGLAFFAGLTGRASKELYGRTYRGAPLLQHAPVFPAIGNHEVMGRWSDTVSLNNQFNDPQPREVAEQLWRATRPAGEDRGAWLAERSWDVTTYEEMFPYPRSGQGGPRWWSRSIGDVHLISLFVTQIWRSPAAGTRGKFQEAPADLDKPENWGYGQHIFEPIKRGSKQYEWLEQELTSNAARRARYRVVMYHHPGHGLGDNSAPPFTDPVQTIHRDSAGAVTAVTYDYPLADDYILRDLEPLFSDSGVHLVHNGHSHLWNRFRNDRGVNWLETSNVGNSYGAYDVSSGAVRNLPEDPDHVRQGDPGGLAPIVPTIAPLVDAAGQPLPYVSSNDITVFSVLDSGAGVVRSYRFDTREPDSEVVLFDEMPLG